MTNEIKSMGKDEAFYIENFITPEEAKAIISYLEWSVKAGYISWNQISFYESYAMGFWENGDPNLTKFGLSADYFLKLKIKIKDAAEKALGLELSEVSYHAQKWIEGAFASFHSDNSDENGEYTAFERSKYAVFMYLNEDFEGGKLNFKNYDVSLQPKTGLIAIFSGGHNNEHEVTTVKNGTRYTIGSFWDKAGIVYTDEQRKRWANELAKVRAGQEEEYKEWRSLKEKGVKLNYISKDGTI